MEITKELVERIARLSRLALSEEEKERMSAQLEDILGKMVCLDDLQLEEDEMCCGGPVNVLRPDEVRPGTERAVLLDCAPQTDGEYILVPGSMGRGEQE